MSVTKFDRRRGTQTWLFMVVSDLRGWVGTDKRQNWLYSSDHIGSERVQALNEGFKYNKKKHLLYKELIEPIKEWTVFPGDRVSTLSYNYCFLLSLTSATIWYRLVEEWAAFEITLFVYSLRSWLVFIFCYPLFLLQVEVLVGKDRGKQGIVSKIVHERNWVFVEGLNVVSIGPFHVFAT